MTQHSDIPMRKSLLCGNNLPKPEEPPDMPPGWQLRLLGWVLALSIVIVVICLLSGCAQAKEIPSNKAIKAIIGEAEGEGYKGMLAVAHAIRNRGTLKGVYGLKSPRVRDHLYSQRTYQNAQQAWAKSDVDFDITHGATGWGNKKDLIRFYASDWWGRCSITAHIGNQWFYKVGR